LISSF